MEVQKKIRKLENLEIALKNARFFKTKKGEYAEKDLFLGVHSGEIRKLAKEYKKINLSDLKKLIQSKYHEERYLGVVILTDRYQNSKDEKIKEQIYQITVIKIIFFARSLLLFQHSLL